MDLENGRFFLRGVGPLTTPFEFLCGHITFFHVPCNFSVFYAPNNVCVHASNKVIHSGIWGVANLDVLCVCLSQTHRHIGFWRHWVSLHTLFRLQNRFLASFAFWALEECSLSCHTTFTVVQKGWPADLDWLMLVSCNAEEAGHVQVKTCSVPQWDKKTRRVPEPSDQSPILEVAGAVKSFLRWCRRSWIIPRHTSLRSFLLSRICWVIIQIFLHKSNKI